MSVVSDEKNCIKETVTNKMTMSFDMAVGGWYYAVAFYT